MNKKKRWLSGVAACIATFGLAFGVTSCDFGDVEVDQELPDDDPDSEVTITFWHCLGDENEKTLEKLVEEFNTLYEGKYEVVLDHIGGDYDALHSNIKTYLNANEVPALAMGYPDSFAEYISNDIGESFLLRLDNFINDEDYGYTEAELNDFVDEYLAEGQNYQFSGTWSMPMYKSTEVAYYNTNYFNGENPQNDNLFKNDTTYESLVDAVVAGGSAPSSAALSALRTYVEENDGYTYDVPETWDEMIAVGRQMIKDLQTEGIYDGTFFPIGYDSDSNMMITQFAQRGISYTQNIDEGEDTSNHYLFVNDAAKDFATEVVTLINEGVLITKNSLGGNTYTNTYFTAKNAAMVIGSTGGSDYNVSSNFGVGLSHVPYYEDEDGISNPKYIMQGPSICFFNNENGYIHKGAWLFYKYIAEPENNAYLALNNSYDPVRKSSYELDLYTNWISDAGYGDLKYDIPNITQTLTEYYMSSPVFVGSSTARTEIGNIISYMVGSKMDVDTAFTTAYNLCTSAS